MTQESGIYARARQALREKWLPLNLGKTFTAEDVYRFFKLDHRTNSIEAKRAFGQALYELSRRKKNPELEQRGRNYRVIDKTLNVIEWWDTKENDTLKINWPYGVEDNTSFGFDESILVYPGDLIVVAGEGNKGKTAFCLNFIVNNMDTMPCYYFTSEFNSAKFKDRMGKFDWVDIMKDGKPKFTLAEQSENFQDVVQPNAINIFDWIRIDEDLFLTRAVLQSIIKPLDRGIAVCVLQKRSYKKVGEGGEGTMDLASVYLTIRYDEKIASNVLRVNKVKSPGLSDPNYKEFKFSIVQSGSKFHAIEELK